MQSETSETRTGTRIKDQCICGLLWPWHVVGRLTDDDNAQATAIGQVKVWVRRCGIAIGVIGLSSGLSLAVLPSGLVPGGLGCLTAAATQGRSGYRVYRDSVVPGLGWEPPLCTGHRATGHGSAH